MKTLYFYHVHLYVLAILPQIDYKDKVQFVILKENQTKS